MSTVPELLRPFWRPRGDGEEAGDGDKGRGLLAGLHMIPNGVLASLFDAGVHQAPVRKIDLILNGGSLQLGTNFI